MKENSGRTGRKRSSRARGDTLPPWDWEFLKKIDQNTMFQLALVSLVNSLTTIFSLCSFEVAFNL